MARTSRKQRNPSSAVHNPPCPEIWNTALYVRLSVEDNGRESDSIENQTALLKRFAADDPTLHVAGIYTDNGYTGTNFLRPAFREMIEAARRGEINCIAVKDLSRLGRNYVETGEFLEKVCPFLGLRFISVSDGFDTASSAGSAELAASLSGIINDYYARDISRKVSTALHTRMERGEYLGKWEKYGYLRDPADRHKLIVDPETAPVVQWIFHLRGKGMSCMGINRVLNELAIPSPGQEKALRGIVTNNNRRSRVLLWNRHVLADLLSDPVYEGRLVQRRTGQSLYEGLPSAAVPEECRITAENTHEPLVSRELFERVQARNRASAEKTRTNRGKYGDLPQAENPFGKKLVCADCGAVMKLHRSIARNGSRAYFSYECPTYSEHGGRGCASRRMKKADLEDAVFRAIRVQTDVYLEKDKLREALTGQEKKAGSTRRTLEHRIEGLRTCRTELYADYRAGLLTAGEFRECLLQRQEERDSLEAEQKDRERQEAEDLARRVSLAEAQSLCEATELSEELLEACVERIRVHADGSLAIEFRFAEPSAEGGAL